MDDAVVAQVFDAAQQLVHKQLEVTLREHL